MKKVLFLFTIMILSSLFLFAQNRDDLGDRAQQILKEITVEQFEDPGFWYGAIPGDMGIIVLNTREGKPLELEPQLKL